MEGAGGEEERGGEEGPDGFGDEGERRVVGAWKAC